MPIVHRPDPRPRADEQAPALTVCGLAIPPDNEPGPAVSTDHEQITCGECRAMFELGEHAAEGEGS